MNVLDAQSKSKEEPEDDRRSQQKEIIVATGSNDLALHEIQLAGKKRMQVQAFYLDIKQKSEQNQRMIRCKIERMCIGCTDQVDKKKNYHIAISNVLEKYQFSEKETAHFTRLVEGTLERQITIDYVADQFSKTKIRKCKPLIRALLRMGIYQILYGSGSRFCCM